jgi:hypothetical protein
MLRITTPPRHGKGEITEIKNKVVACLFLACDACTIGSGKIVMRCVYLHSPYVGFVSLLNPTDASFWSVG